MTNTMRWLAGAAGSGLVGLALLLAGAGRVPAAPPAGPSGPPKVGFITAETKPVYQESSYVGRIQSPQIVALNARVTGYLEQQDFQDGAQVTQGQLLYVIEQPPYEAALEQAQAAVAQAKAVAHNANLTLGRARALLSTPAGQQSNVDSAQANASSNSAAAESAAAGLTTAQINLGYTEIRSPLTGQISATQVNVGNVVGPSSGVLATVVSEDPMYVTFALPAVDAIRLRNQATTSGGGLGGIDLLVQLPDGRMYKQTGRIDFISNQITAGTDTQNWRGTIANPPIPGATLAGATRELTDGEFITAILRSATPEQRIVIPRDAVITDQLGDYVLTLDAQNKVVRQAVTMGPATNASVQIVNGLKAGDRIITQGIQRIHPGIQVQPSPAPAS